MSIRLATIEEGDVFELYKAHPDVVTQFLTTSNNTWKDPSTIHEYPDALIFNHVDYDKLRTFMPLQVRTVHSVMALHFTDYTPDYILQVGLADVTRLVNSWMIGVVWKKGPLWTEYTISGEKTTSGDYTMIMHVMQRLNFAKTIIDDSLNLYQIAGGVDVFATEMRRAVEGRDRAKA